MRRSLVLFFAFVFLTVPLYASSQGAPAGNAPDGKSAGKGVVLEDLSGQDVDVSTYSASSGRPLLLFFWTSWCPFCMKELKGLNQRQKELDKKVDLFAVNAGESRAIVERVVKNNKLEARVFLDQKMDGTETYGIVGVPTFVLINTSGDVIFKDNFFPEEEVKKLAVPAQK